MSLDYIQVSVLVSPREPFAEILISALAEMDFESFEETENGFNAYIAEDKYTADMERDSWAWQLPDMQVDSSHQLIPRINWNKAWEENFQPIMVDNEVYIYAPFHPAKPEIEYNICVEPKMSFGTGHHQTTHMMVQFALELNLKGKQVLDMGCGTGILGILAAMRGANHVLGIDIDEWAVANTIENADRNGVQMDALLGTADALPNKSFEVIFANINKNVLLADMERYNVVLAPGGQIIFSGFYTSDLIDIEAEAAKYGWQFVQKKERDNWQAALFSKR